MVGFELNGKTQVTMPSIYAGVEFKNLLFGNGEQTEDVINVSQPNQGFISTESV